MSVSQSLADLNCTVLENEALSRWSSFRIGGPAKFFVIPQSLSVAAEVLARMSGSGIKYFLFGSGTNILVDDTGYDGVVVYLGARDRGPIDQLISVLSQDDESVLIKVPSFVSKAELLSWSIRQGLGGLEFSAGIPGTMGGAVWMNAGTKWGSYADVITEVTLSHQGGALEVRSSEQMGFTYRGHGEGVLSGNTLVFDVTLRLKKLRSMESSLCLVQEILEYRGARQPLNFPNCGSVFKNPVGSEKGAGRLIEAAGLKGTRIGGAQISPQHANFILNVGAAKAADVKQLMQLAQDKVYKLFSIRLEPEVILL